MKQRIALVVGAGGLTGGHCLSFLLESASYDGVRILTRRPLGIQHPRLDEHIVDFDSPDSYRELLAVEDIYCCLGTTMKKAGSREAFYKVDYTYTVTIAREASKRKTVRFLVVSAMGADPGSSIFYNRVKGEMETAVRACPFRAVHIFRPSLLLGKRNETRFMEGLGQGVSRVLSPLMAGRLKKYRPIRAEVLAWAMVSVGTEKINGGIFESDMIQEWYDRYHQARLNSGGR